MQSSSYYAWEVRKLDLTDTVPCSFQNGGTLKLFPGTGCPRKTWHKVLAIKKLKLIWKYSEYVKATVPHTKAFLV